MKIKMKPFLFIIAVLLALPVTVASARIGIATPPCDENDMSPECQCARRYPFSQWQLREGCTGRLHQENRVMEACYRTLDGAPPNSGGSPICITCTIRNGSLEICR